MERKKILLLTHGGWGMELVKSLSMILGTIECAHEIPLLPCHTMAEYKQLVEEYVKEMGSDAIIITDLMGGTTSNIAALVARQSGIKVISGLNAPMLLEACSQVQFGNEVDFNHILDVGQNACKDVVCEVLKNIK